MRSVRLRVHVPNQSASDVYATLANFERYPELSDAVKSVAVTRVSENITVSLSSGYRSKLASVAYTSLADWFGTCTRRRTERIGSP